MNLRKLLPLAFAFLILSSGIYGEPLVYPGPLGGATLSSNVTLNTTGNDNLTIETTSETFYFNITNNPESTANITKVKITIPSNFLVSYIFNSSWSYAVNSSNIIWSGNSINNSSYFIFSFNATPGNVSANQTFIWNVTLTFSNNGVLPLNATSLVVNDPNPPVSAITNPPNKSYFNTAPIQINGTASDPAPSSGIKQVQVIISNGSQNFYAIANGTTNWNYVFDPSDIFNPGEGIYNVTSLAVDNVENIENSSSQITIIYDKTPPTIILNSPANGTLTNNNLTLFNFSFTDVYSSTSNCSLYVDNNEINFNSSVLNNTYSNFTIELPDGAHSWFINCTDLASNFAVSETRTIKIDTVKPTINFVSPTPSNNSYLSQNWVYINVSTDENVTSALLEWDNGTLSNLSMNGSGKNWYLNQTNLPDGDYSFKVYATDLAGNTNVSGTLSLTIDTTPPTIDYEPSTDTNGTYSKNWIYIKVHPDDLHLSNNIFLEFNNPTNTWNETFAQNNSINFWTNKTGLSDGTYTFRAWAEDLAGNKVSTKFRKITLDTTPPTLLSVSPANGSTGVSIKTNIVITFDEAINDSTVSGTSFYLKKSSGGNVSSVLSASGNSSEFTLNPSSNLTYSTNYTIFVSGSIQDLAGNSLGSNYIFTFRTQNKPSSGGSGGGGISVPSNSSTATNQSTTSENQAPVVQPIGYKIAFVGREFNLKVNATDPDGDPLTYSDNTNLFDIDPSTGLISFTPKESDVGLYKIKIAASDGNLEDTSILTLRIIKVVNLPVPGLPVEKVFKVSSKANYYLLSAGDTISLNIKGFSHTISLERISPNSVSLLVKSNPILLNLSNGATRSVDLNNDNINDLSISLISIEGGSALITLKSIGEEMPNRATGYLIFNRINHPTLAVLLFLSPLLAIILYSKIKK